MLARADGIASPQPRWWITARDPQARRPYAHGDPQVGRSTLRVPGVRIHVRGDRGPADGESSRTHAAMTTGRTQLSSGGAAPRTRTADAEARAARHHYQAVVDVH